MRLKRNLCSNFGSREETVWAGPYQPCKSSNGKAFLAHAVYETLPCGCFAIGNGTLPDPLSVEHCDLHSHSQSTIDRLLVVLGDCAAALEVAADKLADLDEDQLAEDVANVAMSAFEVINEEKSKDL